MTPLNLHDGYIELWDGDRLVGRIPERNMSGFQSEEVPNREQQADRPYSLGQKGRAMQ